ncbi:MAG: hypothetical protein KDC49_02725 [Saprospiraceae bacterium]|nr:hypothetical protein [Saprospiraceae bacterium]
MENTLTQEQADVSIQSKTSNEHFKKQFDLFKKRASLLVNGAFISLFITLIFLSYHSEDVITNELYKGLMLVLVILFIKYLSRSGIQRSNH